MVAVNTKNSWILSILTLFISIFVHNVKSETNDYTLCASRKTSTLNRISEDDELIQNTTSETSYEKCYNNNYCYTLWQENGNDSLIVGQGCWVLSGWPNECDKSACTADTKPPKAKNNTRFCCCSTDMCNENFTNSYVPSSEDDHTTSTPEIAIKDTINTTCIWLLISFLCCLIFLFAWVSYLFFGPWKRNKNVDDIESSLQPLPTSTNHYSLDKLKLLNIIGQGRYGSVWKGTIDEQEIAVKVFPSHHRNYFLNEHNMYNASGENAALLKCFRGGEYVTSPGGPVDYLLILSLEKECLQEYLKKNTLDLASLGKMSLGIARGLAHLHSDLGKPCIAHRDINTRNILVRNDLSCCICDLGLAVIPRDTENRSLTEAGTLRYMSPEVLEGAVNLRDCESALKQIDVYALGLVLWEIGVRCTDMQNMEPQSYAPPFSKETGENPSLEQMQTLVSRRKVRPLWPQSWKDTSAARLLCETSEDCWDQDAEARLTALCVVERLLELPLLKGRVLHPMHPPSSPLINNNHIHENRQIDVSVGTIETLLSPTEENCKNSNQTSICITPLQPFQGRNPCMERNLNSDTSNDNFLIEKSFKHNHRDSQSLITNDYLNFQQLHSRAAPIPYLQNAVHGSPKKNNNNFETNNKKSSKFKWNGFRNLFHVKKRNPSSKSEARKHTQVKLRSKLINGQNHVTTMLLGEQEMKRPSTLPLKETCTNSGVNHLIKRHAQSSLEHFSEIFLSTNDLTRLKDPSTRIKTPGDVPPSVRRTRGKAAKESRFSLYDDRIMTCRDGQWGSAPELEPTTTTNLLAQNSLKNPQINELQDRDSVSSF